MIDKSKAILKFYNIICDYHNIEGVDHIDLIDAVLLDAINVINPHEIIKSIVRHELRHCKKVTEGTLRIEYNLSRPVARKIMSKVKVG